MSDKVRRIDFSPDEFLAGVNGMRAELIGVYWVVCSLIYSRGEPVDNDAKWIGRICAAYRTSDCRRWLDELIALGKLSVNDEGKLQNGRAMVELGRALDRVDQARESGKLGGRPRRKRAEVALKSRSSRADLDPVSAEINDLAKAQPSTINHQPPKKDSETLSSESVRARARKATSKTINGGQHDDDGRQRLPSEWVPSTDEVDFARSLGLDPEAVADAYRLWWSEGKGRREARSAKGWAATWRGWCRRDAERRGGGASAHGGAPDRPARGGGLAGAAARVRARHHGS